MLPSKAFRCWCSLVFLPSERHLTICLLFGATVLATMMFQPPAASPGSRAQTLDGLVFTKNEWTERAVQAHLDQAQYQGRVSEARFDRLVAHGEQLFRARFTIHDGVGRPNATQAIIPTKRRRPAAFTFQRLAGLDAGSCATCHRDPIVGGSGDFALNAFVSEGFVTPDFDTIDPQFSNERNTNHLFGAGLIELLAREMTSDLHTLRRQALRAARLSGRKISRRMVTKGVDFGTIVAQPNGLVDLDQVKGVDFDLVVRPFGQKGVIGSLRQFTINALNHHHGMQATERFGPRWTGENDFDGDGKLTELSPGDVSALVAWQATLGPPVQQRPSAPDRSAAVKRGSLQFDELGCENCHRRFLPLQSTIFVDPGPYETAGTLRQGDIVLPTSYDLADLDGFQNLERDGRNRLLVPLFGDLKRHRMTDRQVSSLGNELLSQRFVDRTEFQTTELWGIGSTAPYGHRGDFTTLDGVIRAHGGDARTSRDRYLGLTSTDRRNIILFLKTLVIEQ
ncbi:MAG: di-heme oxidoredictase family protein [Hyphomicrobiaceae bacterium]